MNKVLYCDQLCFICSINISPEKSDNSAGDCMRKERDLGLQGSDHLYVSWSSPLRLVLKDTSESESYHLSNLCKLKPDEDWDDVCYEYEEIIDDQIPREEQLVILEIDGTSPSVNRKRAWPASFFNRKFAHFSPQAYTIHDYCWRLLKTVVGADAEDKLDSIIQCLENSWNRETLANLIARNKWTRGYVYTLCNDEQRKLHFGDNEEYRISLTDPETVPEISELISEVLLQGMGPQKKKPLADISLHVNYMPSCDASHSIFRNLPDDIVYMVLDYLPPSDCHSLSPLIGFIPPQSYWYRRVKCWPFFLPETPKMTLDKDVDWEYLARRIEVLMTESHGLLNRQRIISTILSVKENVG